MKRCPQCEVIYYDDTLDFCTEDGKLLLSDVARRSETPTVLSGKVKTPNEFKTINLPVPDPDEIREKNVNNKLSKIKEKAAYQGIRTIEIAPIIIALVHNYWQWIYFDKTRYNQTIDFLTSGSFLIWFALLLIGTVLATIALKYGKNKGFAITALVILGINLLLSLVPLK